MAVRPGPKRIRAQGGDAWRRPADATIAMVPASAPAPATHPSVRTDIDPASGWSVVIHNDDVTPFEVVILGLQRACGLSEEVAEMVAWDAHANGSAPARRGLERAEAEAMAGRITALTRIPGLCPGVKTTVEDDG